LLDDAKQQPGVTQNAGLLRHRALKTLERVKGIEPSSSAWKAVALPLSYTRGTRCPFIRDSARLRDHSYRLACQPKPAASAGEGWWER
jgi:hypothetical protein